MADSAVEDMERDLRQPVTTDRRDDRRDDGRERSATRFGGTTGARWFLAFGWVLWRKKADMLHIGYTGTPEE